MAGENCQQDRQAILRGLLREVGMAEKRTAQRSWCRGREGLINDSFQRRLEISRIQFLLYTAGAPAGHPPSDEHRA